MTAVEAVLAAQQHLDGQSKLNHIVSARAQDLFSGSHDVVQFATSWPRGV